MTTEHQGAFILALKGAFGGSIDEPTAQELLRYCGHWRREDARAAIDRLVSEGRPFLPKPGELVAALERARGGRGSFGARAALAGLTVAEYDAQCRAQTARAVKRRAGEPVRLGLAS
jgi:hypothetical protein